MNRQRFCRWLLTGCVLLLFGNDARAQLLLDAHVVGGGGGSAGNGVLTVAATFGQPVVGRIAQAANELSQGFWNPRHDKRQETISTATAVEGNRESDMSVVPNPVTESCDVTFSIVSDGRVTASLYDFVGRHVATLLDERREAGTIRVAVDAAMLPSGNYAIVVTAPGIHRSMPLTVAR